VRVAFLHARQDPACALLMLASVRRHMDCEIVQLTDDDDPALPGCTVQRMAWDGKAAMLFRLQHLARMDGEILLLDTDVIVQHDLSKVFAFPFDIALTRRDGPILDPQGNDLVKWMPYNGGVVFSRCRAFWRQCHAWLSAQDSQLQNWYGDQLALAKFANCYDLMTLHCDNFNYSPSTEDEDVSGHLAVHYKGNRKKWMLLRKA